MELKNNMQPNTVKKVWQKPTLVVISANIAKGPQFTHEAALKPTHKANGLTYSKFGNNISSLVHYHS